MLKLTIENKALINMPRFYHGQIPNVKSFFFPGRQKWTAPPTIHRPGFLPATESNGAPFVVGTGEHQGDRPEGSTGQSASEPAGLQVRELGRLAAYAICFRLIPCLLIPKLLMPSQMPVGVWVPGESGSAPAPTPHPGPLMAVTWEYHPPR